MSADSVVEPPKVTTVIAPLMGLKRIGVLAAIVPRGESQR